RPRYHAAVGAGDHRPVRRGGDHSSAQRHPSRPTRQREGLLQLTVPENHSRTDSGASDGREHQVGAGKRSVRLLEIRMRGKKILVALAFVAQAAQSQAVLLQIRPHIGDTLRMHLSQQVEMTGTTRDSGRDSISTMTTSIEVFTRAIAEQWTSGGTLMQTITDSVQTTPASQ